MSRLKSWLSYVNQFDPSFRQSLRPASSTEIDQLTQLAGPLPSSYVEFLKVMGQSLGNLKVQEANLTVIEATQFYQAVSYTHLTLPTSG